MLHLLSSPALNSKYPGHDPMSLKPFLAFFSAHADEPKDMTQARMR